MALPLWVLLLIIGIGLICVGKYAATPPIANWCFGAGVFCCAVALIILLYVLLAGANLKLA